jgi:hypothetical protein
MMVFLGVFLHQTVRVIRSAVEPLSTVATAVFWAMIVWAVGGLTTDLLLAQMSQIVLFFSAVLVERCYALTRATMAQNEVGPLLQAP